MEIVLKKKDDCYAGYPVMTKQMKAGATNWAGKNAKSVELNSTLTNCQFYHYTDEANNKVFKVKTLIEDLPVTFSISIESVLDLLDNGTLDKSLIKNEMTFIEGGRLVMVNGKLHKGYLELKEKMKAPSLTEYTRGHLYTRKEGDKYQHFLYLGSTTKYHFVECSGMIEYLERPNGYSNLVSVIKPSFRSESGKVGWDLKEILNHLIKVTGVCNRSAKGSTKYSTDSTKYNNKIKVYKEIREKYYGEKA